jgi:hypothetical protein
VFSNRKFDEVNTGISIVTTKWAIERPMVFKAGAGQAHGRTGTFSPPNESLPLWRRMFSFFMSCSKRSVASGHEAELKKLLL